MKNDKLLLILIILVGFGVLIDLVNTIGLALLAYEVKPLISEVKPLINEVSAKMDSFELPDFSSVNELMVKFERVIDIFPLSKVKDFIGVWNKLDEADMTEEFILLIPLMKKYYVNGSCLN